ncbi:MAG TPA: chemotaxis protein CheW [Polyangia bacterium]
MSLPAGRQVLTFRVGGGEYGIDLLRAREIVPFVGPSAPGTGCLRGTLPLADGPLPLVEVGVKVGEPPLILTPRTCVVVADGPGLRVGLIVDEIGAVLDLAAAEVGPVPRLGLRLRIEHLAGVGAAGGRLVLLLDLDHLLDERERGAALQACVAAPGAHP